MSKSDDRVLSHLHARQLTQEEFNHVGGAYLTNKTGDCTFDPQDLSYGRRLRTASGLLSGRFHIKENPKCRDLKIVS